MRNGAMIALKGVARVMVVGVFAAFDACLLLEPFWPAQRVASGNSRASAWELVEPIA